MLKHFHAYQTAPSLLCDFARYGSSNVTVIRMRILPLYKIQHPKQAFLFKSRISILLYQTILLKMV